MSKHHKTKKHRPHQLQRPSQTVLADWHPGKLPQSQLRSLFSYPTQESIDKYADAIGIRRDDRTKVLFVYSDSNGCGYYRGYIPMHALSGKYGDRFQVINTQGMSAELLRIADVVVMQRASSHQINSYVRQFASDKIVVSEDDDNLLLVPPDNPAYQVYNPLSFDTLDWMTSLKAANAHQVSTMHLKYFLEDSVATDKPIAVLPNSILDSDFSGTIPTDYNTDLFWSGSVNHLADLGIIDSPIAKLQQEMHLTFTAFGWNGSIGKQSVIPRVKVTRFLPFVEPMLFTKTLSTVRPKIALAPLMDYEFNFYKSPLRLIQYAAQGYCILSSDVLAYQGFPGVYYVDNQPRSWYDAIKYLLANPDERQKRAEQTKRYVWENYRIENNIHLWAEFYGGLKK